MRGCAGAILGLAASCGTGRPATAPPPGPPLPAPGPARAGSASRGAPASPLGYLDDDYARLFPLRVRLARRGDVRFRVEDAPAVRTPRRNHPIDAAQSPRLVLIDRAGDRVRVVVDEDEVRVLLWLDGADLYPVATEATGLRREPAEAASARDGRVHVHTGAALEVAEEQGDQVRVSVMDECLTVEGWMSRDRLGREHVAVDPAAAAARDRVVSRGAVLLDRPGGQPVARLHADCDVTTLGGEVEGFLPVVHVGLDVDVRGWAATAEATPAAPVPAGASGATFGMGGLGFRSLERFHLPAGTCLHGERAGPVIGVVTDDTDVSGAHREDGWWRLSVRTGWGALLLWVAEDGPPPVDPPPTGEREEDPVGLLGGPRPISHPELTTCR